jgi:hypothetical protein
MATPLFAETMGKHHYSAWLKIHCMFCDDDKLLYAKLLGVQGVVRGTLDDKWDI